MSIYTPPSPDHYAVLEGVDHFRKSSPGGVPAYADVSAWSRLSIEDPSSDPQFLEADIAALADAIYLALEHVQQKALAKVLKNSRARYQRPVPSAQSAAGVR